jgi:hypothetical protein
MTFQAYIDNVHAKTGLWPDDFAAAARAKDLLRPDVKVTALVEWLTADYDLGRGHAMAIVQAFRNDGLIAPAPSAAKRAAKPAAG